MFNNLIKLKKHTQLNYLNLMLIAYVDHTLKQFYIIT